MKINPWISTNLSLDILNNKIHIIILSLTLINRHTETKDSFHKLGDPKWIVLDSLSKFIVKL